MNFLTAQSLPIFGWFGAAIKCILISCPMWILWNWLAPTYFTFMASQWQNIPFWHMCGLVWIAQVVSELLLPHFMRVKMDKPRKTWNDVITEWCDKRSAQTKNSR